MLGLLRLLGLFVNSVTPGVPSYMNAVIFIENIGL